MSPQTSKWQKVAGKSRGKGRAENPGILGGIRLINGVEMIRTTASGTGHNHGPRDQITDNMVEPPFLNQFPRMIVLGVIGRYMLTGLVVRTKFLLFLDTQEKYRVMVSGSWMMLAMWLIDSQAHRAASEPLEWWPPWVLHQEDLMRRYQQRDLDWRMLLMSS